MSGEDKPEKSKGKRKKGVMVFGSEATNRPLDVVDEADEIQTPPKRQKLANDEENTDWRPVKSEVAAA